MDPEEYEIARNETLLFFLELLLDRDEPRTFHDLSCQFGTKGFTNRMRQIVGKSQNGLKKLLSQYPFLFHINDEYVSVRTDFALNSQAFKRDEIQDSSINSIGRRDYEAETVEYFANKLAQYGANTEVPIQSLLGHRSQANQEVRHISGQHIKEFRDFLLKHPETFDVTNDTVILKDFDPDKYPACRELPDVSIDPEITQNLLDFFAQCIEVKGPILVDQLFHLVISRFPQEQWSQMFKTSQDLTTFLKMFSDAFHVQANLVTLNQWPKLDVIQLSRNKNKLNRPKKDDDRINDNINRIMQQINELKAEHSKSDSLDSAVDVNDVDDKRARECTNSPSHTPSSNQSLKQRFNSVVMKTLAQNVSQDNKSLTAGAGSTHVSTSVPDHLWKMRIFSNTRIISTTRECQQVLDAIVKGRKNTFDGQVVVAFDCKGMFVSKTGQITLCQIGTLNGKALIFDLLTCPGMIQHGLKHILESDSVIKIMHDCRLDSLHLLNQFGITLKNVFDTQVAHMVMQQLEQNVPVTKTKNCSLNFICEHYGAPANPLKDQMKAMYRKDSRYWSRRPLTREMTLFATADVLCLVHENLFPKMWTRIRAGNLTALFNELCYEQILCNVNVVEVKLRKRQRKIDHEVSELRQKISQTEAKKIFLSNREIRLLRYIDLNDEEKDKLKGSQKVARKLEKLNGADDKDSSESDNECDEYPSLDSNHSDSSSKNLSPRGSEPQSLTESMQFMNDILSDNRMSRIEKIERLEALLDAATSMQSDSENIESAIEKLTPCCCNCHNSLNSTKYLLSSPMRANSSEPTISDVPKNYSIEYPSGTRQLSDVQCQTLSTGDIVVTKIHFDNNS